MQGVSVSDAVNVPAQKFVLDGLLHLFEPLNNLLIYINCKLCDFSGSLAVAFKNRRLVARHIGT